MTPIIQKAVKIIIGYKGSDKTRSKGKRKLLKQAYHFSISYALIKVINRIF